MTRIIGHRGARNLWPENSMTGFTNVRSLGIEAAEFDVHLTDSGEIVVMHDPTLDRTTEGTGPTRALTPEARRSLRLRDTDEGVPVLDDVLGLFASTDMTVHVEIKTDGDGIPYPGLESRVIDALKTYRLEDRCRLTCFNADVLRECRRLAPHLPGIFAVGPKAVENLGLDAALERALNAATYVGVHIGILAEQWDEVVEKVPLTRLGAWVPNTAEELRIWLSRGLAQVTTDRPDIAVAVRNELRAEVS
jgi:glycerophosphoryl diester phosphodiesterase